MIGHFLELPCPVLQVARPHSGHYLTRPASRQFSHEPPEVEPPTQRQDLSPAQSRKDEGASAAQRPELEADGQELVQTKTGYERGDGPDVKGMCLPNPEPGKLPESEKQSALKDTLK
uniref:GAGE domain-containing protein n=1 Tax=Piliocolobus tephrosceles TaxID=591936 RepID=A0A8C9IYU3_9PRIM